ncbi:MAG: glycogen/starch synthase [Candidatus Symbiothrix sp.]|jgi:glycosyltransferase involved in cell wall biosynthesis|nr:glycogen/starch synthase [Candidatus Symbiothrix sp.]
MINISKGTPDVIFEASWEVCNKVGGIYTVLSTKARTLQSLFPDRIIFIGPDVWHSQANPDFMEDDKLLWAWKKQFAEKEHLSVRVGHWNVPGKPVAVLVDFKPLYSRKNAFYFYMWENYGIDSTVGYGDYDDSCMFAYATALVIESLYHFLKLHKKQVIAHMNEWMLGMAVLYLHGRIPKIATVFTTHATSIGRSICGNGKPLYGQFSHYNGDQMAIELNMVGKHQLEKQAAHHADCFTTVSAITGRECTQLLEKTPDVITPNGFESDFVPDAPLLDEKRRTARESLLRVAEELTGAAISDSALLIATSGRYEYHNKGLDLFIESLFRVKQAKPDRDVVAFILVPAWTKGARKTLQHRAKNTHSKKYAGLTNPFLTHDLMQPEQDEICNYLRYLQFTNQDNDPVKIIFVPSYLDGQDGIFNIPYYDLLTGFDLTVFPSYYEPWGYTPLESIAFHIPTVTTNLAGFGVWANSVAGAKHILPVVVIRRDDNNYFDAAEAIKNAILEYAQYDSEQVATIRKAASALSKKAEWEQFIEYYLQAYTLALK